LTNKDLTFKILQAVGRGEEMIEHVEDRAGHDKRYAIDFSKIKNELGWEPEISFEDGLKEMVKWYKDNYEWVKNCKSGEYKEYYKRQYNI